MTGFNILSCRESRAERVKGRKERREGGRKERKKERKGKRKKLVGKQTRCCIDGDIPVTGGIKDKAWIATWWKIQLGDWRVPVFVSYCCANKLC